MSDTVCAECDLLLKLQNSNPYGFILSWKTKKQTYMIHVRDNLNKEIHIPRTNVKKRVKAKRSSVKENSVSDKNKRLCFFCAI